MYALLTNKQQTGIQSVNGGSWTYTNTTYTYYDVFGWVETRREGTLGGGGGGGVGCVGGNPSGNINSIGGNPLLEPVLYGHLCPRQFSNPSTIGSAYYINLTNLKMTYLTFPPKLYTVGFSSLCIQMPAWAGKNLFANAIADCFDTARRKVFDDYQNGVIQTSADGQNAFQQYYRSDLANYINTSVNSVTVTKQACSGSASVTPEWTWTFFSCPN